MLYSGACDEGVVLCSAGCDEGVVLYRACDEGVVLYSAAWLCCTVKHGCVVQCSM